MQLQQAFAMHGAFQRFNPHPPVGAGATAPSAAPMPGIARFQSSPARGGGCNPYPQHTPSASVVASGWSVEREWGWIQMEQMERQFGKSHLRRVFWGFFGSICSICSICSMRAARQKSPAPCLGGARLAVRGAIIPNCDHARKVGGNASPACNSSAPFEIIHNGRCIPAKLGCCSARINQSNRVFLKAPRSTVFGTAQVGGGSSEGGMRRVRGDWACSRGGHGRVRGAIRRA